MLLLFSILAASGEI
jgi:hypothetical protein